MAKKKFSPSKLTTYLTCPRKYKFKYLENLPEGTYGIELFLGTKVHETLEWSFATTPTPDLAQALKYFNDKWVNDWKDYIKITKAGKVKEDYRLMGEECLKNYWGREKAFEHGGIVGLEMMLDAPLDKDGEYWIWGYADRVVKTGVPGHYEIRDYKTGAWVPSQKDAESEIQLPVYNLGLLNRLSDCTDVTLVYDYVFKNKQVKFNKTPRQLAYLKTKLLKTIKSIESETEWKTCVTKLCDWCSYKGICPAFNKENTDATSAKT